MRKFSEICVSKRRVDVDVVAPNNCDEVETSLIFRPPEDIRNEKYSLSELINSDPVLARVTEPKSSCSRIHLLLFDFI
jgi:hypothetical protein